MALACARTKDSDKPVHPGSLVGVVDGHYKGSQDKTLIDSVGAQTDFDCLFICFNSLRLFMVISMLKHQFT